MKSDNGQFTMEFPAIMEAFEQFYMVTRTDCEGTIDLYEQKLSGSQQMDTETDSREKFLEDVPRH